MQPSRFIASESLNKSGDRHRYSDEECSLHVRRLSVGIIPDPKSIHESHREEFRYVIVFWKRVPYLCLRVELYIVARCLSSSSLLHNHPCCVGVDQYRKYCRQYGFGGHEK